MIYLHIGTHKTGSKSIQEMLNVNRFTLRERGYSVYKGLPNNNYAELLEVSIREGRDFLGKYSFPEFDFGESYKSVVLEHIAVFLANAEKNILFSSEDLCWLRFEDEIDKLKSIIGIRRDQVKIILFLRNMKSFQRSYTAQIYKKPGRLPSESPDSVLYVEDDSWLWDYDSLVKTYKTGFGEENVHVIDYDEVLSAEGTVIPAYLRACDIGLNGIKTDQYLHRTTSDEFRKAIAYLQQ
jgi:hypothetical protein